MTIKEFIKKCEYKPLRIPVCRECIGKKHKDCETNPLKCIDFYILNKNVIDDLRDKELI